MSDAKRQTGPIRLGRLARTPHSVEIAPDCDARRALCESLGLLDLRKLRLKGQILPDGDAGWRLEAMLGATVVQPCVITLDPVTTRIDEAITRRYSPDAERPDAVSGGEEIEMPEDDTLEPLPETLDLEAVLTEALALALPPWPRSPGAEIGTRQAAPEGAVPLKPEQTRPFAGLAELRDRLAKSDGESSAEGDGEER